MLYCGYLLMFGVVVGMAAVAANPSPFYAALGLVMVAAMGCGFIMCLGGTFSCLVLFLIYLGGMLVVFAYSVALCADALPTGLAEGSVLKSMVGYLGLTGVMALSQQSSEAPLFWWFVGQESEMSVMQGETDGVSEAYGSGGILLVTCGWALLVALYVALEVSRGCSRGPVRPIK
uniref:NADH-ubiquinone oxidoreductase chain 6 n=1 Tax=Notothenia rossii TaxID=101497 RepID=D6N188_9TELE|nr:NADH dehydrogenase subunit 6 [Notothenia rossii]ACZ62682.1 NADH dehydrogenase subunit 6 [Notothenia rossii]QJQ26904.1 NADH dehydrogenase subunit 6 [Notothenia rossii]QJQ26905.1 NADH dehydrogenase subunit 6 [Notothenia rossii]QNK05415.1 NADH dehydrogenase subunit 6 [Notothenia rossii]